MAAPNTEFKIRNPGLGIVEPGAAGIQAKIAVAQKLTPNVVYTANSPQSAVDQAGSGPMLDSVGQVLGVAGGPVRMVAATPTTYGAVTGSFALTGSGAGTVVGSKGPEAVVAVKIVLGGTPGTMTYQIKIGSGAYGATITSTADPYSLKVPGQQFTELVFGNVTFVAADVYTLNLDGTVTRTGTGPATALDNSTHSPVDAYDVWVEILTSGALATATFKYSLDGGASYSGAIVTPAAGKYVIPGTGIVLTFASTFVKGDIYKGVSTAASFGTSEVTTAITALLAGALDFEFIHVVGTPANAAAAVTLATTVGAALDTAELGHRFLHAIVECPTSESISTIAAAVAAFVHARVSIVAGDIYLLSPLTARTQKRNLGWAYSARESAIRASVHPGQVADEDGMGGPLANVVSIVHNEEATPGLDDARLVTARQFAGGEPGYFVTRGRMMDAPGGDYSSSMNRRVMDLACRLMRSAILKYLNRRVRINKKTGFIDERDALSMEKIITAKLRAILMDSNDPECSDVQFTVSRTDNLLATSTINTETAIIPFGYSETIKVSMGFLNPALAAAA